MRCLLCPVLCVQAAWKSAATAKAPLPDPSGSQGGGARAPCCPRPSRGREPPSTSPALLVQHIPLSVTWFPTKPSPPGLAGHLTKAGLHRHPLRAVFSAPTRSRSQRPPAGFLSPPQGAGAALRSAAPAPGSRGRGLEAGMLPRPLSLISPRFSLFSVRSAAGRTPLLPAGAPGWPPRPAGR